MKNELFNDGRLSVTNDNNITLGFIPGEFTQVKEFTNNNAEIMAVVNETWTEKVIEEYKSKIIEYEFEPVPPQKSEQEVMNEYLLDIDFRLTQIEMGVTL